MRAIKIDPVSKTITEINLEKNPNKTLSELYEIIGCDLVEIVMLDDNILMVVDEEGRLKDIDGAFTFIGYGSIFAGTAILLGGDSESFKALKESPILFESLIEWIAPSDVPPPKYQIIEF